MATATPLTLSDVIGEYVTPESLTVPPSQYDDVLRVEQRVRINEAIKGLSHREALVITKRFGLNDSVELTCVEIGRELGVTGVRIQQIERKALRKLALRVGWAVTLDEQSSNGRQHLVSCGWCRRLFYRPSTSLRVYCRAECRTKGTRVDDEMAAYRRLTELRTATISPGRSIFQPMPLVGAVSNNVADKVRIETIAAGSAKCESRGYHDCTPCWPFFDGFACRTCGVGGGSGAGD